MIAYAAISTLKLMSMNPSEIPAAIIVESSIGKLLIFHVLVILKKGSSEWHYTLFYKYVDFFFEQVKEKPCRLQFWFPWALLLFSSKILEQQLQNYEEGFNIIYDVLPILITLYNTYKSYYIFLVKAISKCT